ncbi:amidase [Legionella maioricensis]|uniref:Amidase n=1 Tax=Legionella maioricensis TaxID=2896528 RepID=A0A9X2D273_9GAMM|nr:amidase [Legionella maioricensis]MCL9685078.1 amidase [Legionella maioricensis]MCL9688161.1 amidase [Legionella maioricensis]
MQDLAIFSAKKVLELIQKKQISCQEVMHAHLEQVTKVNPSINAVVQQLSPEQALKQARAADDAIANKVPLGKLHGLPITIKDARKVKGFMCTYGTQSPMNAVATEDATVVARLRAEGAIVTGITNIPDFSMSYDTENALYGRTNNPYDLGRSPGGSSGGEAAIIAAGGSYLGIGADSGGSIRQPAHNCGIAGLKPTRGLIPDTGHFPTDGLGIFNYVEAQGPLARYVEDLIHVLPILAGPDEQDPNVFPAILQDPLRVNLRSLRVAIYTNNGVVTPRDDIVAVIKKVEMALGDEVLSIQEAYPHVSKESYSAFEELFFYGGDRGQWLRDRMQRMQVTKVAAPFQAILDRAKACEFSVTELRQRIVAMEQFKYSMMDFMRHYDVIICPAATTPANLYENKIAATEGFDLAYDLTYNLPYNITGWPAAVVRCGTSKEGLPIGVQVVAKAWRDDIALAVAKRLEELFGGWRASSLI